MPYATNWSDPEIFTSINGVRVFHTYKEDNVDEGRSRYFYTLNGNDDESSFDVRTLKVPSINLLDTHPPYMSDSYDHWKNASTEERETMKQQWSEWHASGEEDAIKAIIKEALESGLLSEVPASDADTVSQHVF